MPQIVPNKTLRFFLVFTISLGLALASRMAALYVFADETADQPENKYTAFLDGEDFEIPCESALSSATNSLARRLPGQRSVKILIERYNDGMNCLFNMRIKAMTEELKKLDEKADSTLIVGTSSPFAPPEFDIDPETKLARGRKPCPLWPSTSSSAQQNLSTYCLAQDATREYFDFRDALQNKQKELRQEAMMASAKTKDKKEGQKLDLSGISGGLKMIDIELNNARQTIDYALAAYNEMQLALPMHYQYRQVIKRLEQYRNEVAGIRKQIDLFPDTFIDVTTTQCT